MTGTRLKKWIVLVISVALTFSMMPSVSFAASSGSGTKVDYQLILDSETGKVYKNTRSASNELTLNTNALKGLTYEDGNLQL